MFAREQIVAGRRTPPCFESTDRMWAVTIKVRIDSVFKSMFLLICTFLFDNFIALFYLFELFALNFVICFARFVHVHGQKQATILVCRQRKRKDIGTLKECNKKYKLTETSIQNSESIRTLIVTSWHYSKQGGAFKAGRRS